MQPVATQLDSMKDGISVTKVLLDSLTPGSWWFCVCKFEAVPPAHSGTPSSCQPTPTLWSLLHPVSTDQARSLGLFVGTPDKERE